MRSFQDYQRMTHQRGINTTGNAHSVDAKDVIEASWNDDPASMIAYFYDYDHDDEKDKNHDLHPEKSKTKIPIEIKYILSAYKTLNKDEVDLRIMFKPSYKCTVPYYKEKFEELVGGTFPTGLYCDIADENGIWNRWLVVATASKYNHDFPTWAILPCGYKFQWIHNGKKMELWGVEQSQNSYNSGVWRDYKVESIENQTKALLPYNEISKTLYYNTRAIISVDLPQPIAWRVTKVEGLAHKGNIMFTFGQDLFDEHHDYIERDADGKLVGMWANYFQDGNLPVIEEPDREILPLPVIGNYAEMTYTGTKPQLKINGGYKSVSIAYYNSGELIKNQTPGQWMFIIDDVDVSEMITVHETDTPNTIKIKFLGDETYMHKVLKIRNEREDASTEIKFELISL